MKAYLLGITGTILLSALLTAILPEGKATGSIKSITRLVCILAIVSPVLHFFKNSNGENGEKFMQTFFQETSIERDEEIIQYYSELRIKEAQRYLEEETLKNFGVQTSITLIWEKVEETIAGKYKDTSIKITKIEVSLKEETTEDIIKSMWEYMTKHYCSEVKIE